MGRVRGLWRAFVGSAADALYEFGGGNLLVRATAAHAAGDTTLTVEGTHRWPSSGRGATNRFTFRWSGKTNTTLTGITDDDGNAGLPGAVPNGSPVADASRTETQLDRLRAVFLLLRAEGADLDVLARIHGLLRPLGLSDSKFRDLLRVWIYLPAQTVVACHEVCDAILGPGNYELYESLVEPVGPTSGMHTVVLSVGAVAGTDPSGKAYLVGGEPQPRSTTSTVVAADPPVIVYGVWDSADPFRKGTNHAEVGLTCYTDAAQPKDLQSGTAFLAADVGKWVRIGSESWRVDASTGPFSLRLGWPTFSDAYVNSGTPDRLFAETARFAPWMVGHEVTIPSGANAGTYAIAEYLSPTQLRLTGAAFASELGLDWELVPSFGTVGSLTAYINRATVAGSTITVPAATLPANVLLDYTTVETAQVLPSLGEDGDDGRSALYLFEEAAAAVAVLDLVTAAGVRVVLETT